MKFIHFSRSNLAALLPALILLAGCTRPWLGYPPERAGDWPAVGRTAENQRFSPLAQINRDNVHRLEPAWTFHTGDIKPGSHSTIECNPLIVDGTMYITSPMIDVIALDAASGEEKWRFDPGRAPGVNRGVTFWEDGEDRRILFTANDELIALDAATGRPIESFGEGGRVNLREAFERDISGLRLRAHSPGVIYGDLIILGSSLQEGPGPVPPGHIRAYNVRSGELAWIFHTIPHPGEFGHETWQPDNWRWSGGANAWAGFSVDRDRGMVFAAVGSPAFDFYGGNRKGKNLFGNSVLALDAATGEYRWHFQTVHHDLWDYDLPAPPNLVTVNHEGRPRDAVAQVTKMGLIFLLDRETGEPLFEVEERPVPASDLPGEQAWPTQPVPVRPPPVVRWDYTEDLVTDISPEARARALKRLEEVRYGKTYTPPSREGTIVFPGFYGGINWSGASFDPRTGLLYVNANETPWLLRMVEPDAPHETRWGAPQEDWVHTGWHRFTDAEGYPAVKPPWGTLNAVDLNSGEIAWKVTLGEHAVLTERGLPATGTENFGGTIVTAAGLVFIGATKDRKFRAFDSASGEVLWEHTLPAGGYATPSTYSVDGRQYVVIAAGGGAGARNASATEAGREKGDAIYVFALGE